MLTEPEKNVRHYPLRHAGVRATDGWESIDSNDPVHTIYPTEENQGNLRIPGKKIHDHGVYGNYTDEADDQNAWGGEVITETPVVCGTPQGDSSDVSDIKYNNSTSNYKPATKVQPLNQPWEDTPRGGGYGSVYNASPNHRSDRAEMYYYLFRDEAAKFDWIIPGVLAGGGHPLYYSFKDDLNYLRNEGIQAIVSAFESPLDTKHLTGFEYYFAPTLDGYSSHLIEACEFIESMEKAGKPVFVHCFAGNGRTGTVLAAYLIYKNYLTADEAIAYIRDKYSKAAIETSYQEDELHRLALRL